MTLTPSGAHSTASVFVRLPTPALAAAEWAMPGPPVNDWVARMLQIAPGSPAAAHRRCRAWLQKNVPSSTMRTTARQAFGLMPAASTGKLAAALLTRTRTGPSSSSSRSKAASTWSGSRMSAAASAARPPTASTAATPARRWSSERDKIPTAAPARASSTATALPSPVPPPVTTAVVPAKVSGGSIDRPGGGGSGSITCPRSGLAAWLPWRHSRPAYRRRRTRRTRRAPRT